MSEKPPDPATLPENSVYFDDFNVKAADAVLRQLSPQQINAMGLTFLQAMLDRQEKMHEDLIELLEAVRVGQKRNELAIARIEAQLEDLLDEEEESE